MGDDWAETRMQWARLKANLAEMLRQMRLARADKLAIKSMQIYLDNGEPRSALLLSAALRECFKEDRKP